MKRRGFLGGLAGLAASGAFVIHNPVVQSNGLIVPSAAAPEQPERIAPAEAATPIHVSTLAPMPRAARFVGYLESYTVGINREVEDFTEDGLTWQTQPLGWTATTDVQMRMVGGALLDWQPLREVCEARERVEVYLVRSGRPA